MSDLSTPEVSYLDSMDLSFDTYANLTPTTVDKPIIDPGKPAATDYSALYGGISAAAAGIGTAFGSEDDYNTANYVADIGQWAATGAGIGTMVGGPIIGTIAGAVVGLGIGLFKRKESKKKQAEAERERQKLIIERKRQQDRLYHQYRDKVFGSLKEEKFRSKRRKQDVKEAYDTSKMDAQIVEGAVKYDKLVGDVSTVSSKRQTQQAAYRSSYGAVREAHFTRIEDELDKIQKMVQYIDVETAKSKGLKSKAAHDQAQEAVEGYGDLRESLYA